MYGHSRNAGRFGNAGNSYPIPVLAVPARSDLERHRDAGCGNDRVEYSRNQGFVLE